MNFDLHPHQQQAIEALRASLRAGKRRPMIQAPTGAGKTVIAAAIVDGALSKSKRVLFVVPFLSLIDQTLEAFAKQGISSVGAIQGYHPATDSLQPVQIASIQTLMRRRLPSADIVLVDEAHRWYDFYSTWMGMPEWRNTPFVGLSASPWTKGLGKHYDDLIVAATTSELITKGLLSPFRVYAPAHPDLSEVKTVAGDFHEGQLSDVMRQPTLVAGVVETWLRLGEDRPTLCFAVDRAHARRIADEFEAAGVPAGYVDAKTPRDERIRMGRRLAEGQIKVIVNIATMTTGVDLDVRCIVLARPTKSEILFTQIVGRGLRTAPGKDDCLILDHSDSTLRLGFVTDIHHAALDDGKPRRALGTVAKEQRASLPKECTACSYLKPAGVHKCPACGFAPERQSLIENRGGSLMQLNGKRKAVGADSRERRQEWYSMLLAIGNQRGWKTGAAAHRYRERFGVWPRDLIEVAKAPDLEVRNWMKARQIAFLKGKAKSEAGAGAHAA